MRQRAPVVGRRLRPPPLLGVLCAVAAVASRGSVVRPSLQPRAAPTSRTLGSGPAHRAREERRIALGAQLRTAAASTALGLAAVLSVPDAAHAGFGAPTGAVTSQPPIRSLSAEEIQEFTASKIKQLSSSLQQPGKIDKLLDELQTRAAELQTLVDELQANRGLGGEELESSIKAIREQQEQLLANIEQGRLLKEQLQRRKALLQKLEDQPAWYNYASALAGSVLSTLVMHPVDTIKTRYMAASPRSDAERSVEDLYTPPVPEPKVVKRRRRAWEKSAPKEVGRSDGDEAAGEGAELMTSTAVQDAPREHGDHAPVAEQTAQLDATGAAAASADSAANEYTLEVEVYEDVLEPYDLKAVRKPNSIASLYEGLLGNVLKEGPSSALYLGVYEDVKNQLLATSLAAHPLGVYLLAGATGELIGSIVRAPMEAVKSNVQSGSDTSTFGAAQRVLTTREGLDNVLRAWSSSIWRDVPFGAIQLAVFELTKTFILNSKDISIDINSLQAEALLGAFGGFVGSFVSTPMDVITTRIITQNPAKGDEPIGVLEMAARIYSEGGPSAFFVGWKERVLYWAPAIGLFLSCYCTVRQLGFDIFTD